MSVRKCISRLTRGIDFPRSSFSRGPTTERPRLLGLPPRFSLGRKQIFTRVGQRALAHTRVTHIFRRLAGKSIVSRTECTFELPRFPRKIVGLDGRKRAAAAGESGWRAQTRKEREAASLSRRRRRPYVQRSSVCEDTLSLARPTNRPTSHGISALSLSVRLESDVHRVSENSEILVKVRRYSGPNRREKSRSTSPTEEKERSLLVTIIAYRKKSPSGEQCLHANVAVILATITSYCYYYLSVRIAGKYSWRRR